jgi:hypothetical protein
MSLLNDYLMCALWSSTGDNNEPLDGSYHVQDFAPEALALARRDCERFLAENASDIAGNYQQAGHDFWLTRNRHGAGFWDGDWPKEVGKRLTKASHAYGETDVYVGDDRRLYFSR